MTLIEEMKRGTTVRAALRQVTDRHPELGRAVWHPGRPREAAEYIGVIVNNAVGGISRDLDSELLDGDKITLLGQFTVGVQTFPLL